MTKRRCPICNNNDSKKIMQFTSELLCTINPTYRLKELKAALYGREHYLTYSRCRTCGMVYCDNFWDEATLTKVYTDVIDQEESRHKTLRMRKQLGQVQQWKNVMTLLYLLGRDRLENIKIIDYGCGWGDFIDIVNCEGVEVIGYDQYEITSHIPESRRKHFVNDVDDLIAFAPVDVLFLKSVLEHLQDPDVVLELARKLLKKGGIVAVTVMDYRSGYIKKNAERLKNNNPALSKNLNPVEHVNIYDYASLSATLKKHNFKFLSTGNIMRMTDFSAIPKGMKYISLLNKMERLLSRILRGKELSITAYALNCG